MRSERPEARKSAGRARVLKRPAVAPRRSRFQGLAPEWLEERALLSTIPALVTDPQVPIGIDGLDSFRNIGGLTTTLPSGLTPIQAQSNGVPQDSSPTVAVDRHDPNKLVAVWTSDFLAPPGNPNTLVYMSGAYSNDAGQHWTRFNASPQVFIDPASGSSPAFLAQVTDGSVAFDGNDNFYVLQIQHAAGGNKSGVLALSKYSFASNTPTAVFTGQPLAVWNQGGQNISQTAVFSAQLAVDDNLASYTIGGQTVTDSGAGHVYIAMGVNTPPPSGYTGPWNPNTIQLMASADGGNTFGTPLTVGAGNFTTPEQDARPQLTVSQGTLNGTVIPGQVTVVYDDFGSSGSQDTIFSRSYQPVAATPFLQVIGNRPNFVAVTSIQGTAVGPFGLKTAASPVFGVGPSAVIASDNTIGAASPHSGRLYIAYVDRYTGPDILTNPTDNTDIHLVHSDDGGRTWQTGAGGQPNAGLVNDDRSLQDGYSQAIYEPQALEVTGRAQFLPAVAVDPQTGTLIVSYEDARWDPIGQRTAVSIAASIDGGDTFSPSSFVDAPQYAQDESQLNQGGPQRVALGPIPDNQSAGGPYADPTFGIGGQMGLAAFGGRAYPVWASNLNGGTDTYQPTSIFGGPILFAGGPRVVASTMGQITPGTVVGADGKAYSYNNQVATDGTPLADGFVVTFDRPIDVASFTADQVHVYYRDPSTNGTDPGIIIPVQSPVVGGPAIVPLQAGNTPSGPTEFLVYFATQAGGTPATGNVGTYSYTVGPDVRDTVASTIATNFYYAAQIPNNLPAIPPDASGGNDTGGPSAPAATSTVNITGVPADQAIAGLKVHLSLQHTRDADLKIELIPPSGLGLQPIILFQNPNARGADFTDTVFDDTANPDVAPQTGPFTGRLQPSQALSILRGKNPVGTWTLAIFDTRAGNVGQLLSWGLEVTTRTADGKAAQVGNLMDQDANGVGGEDPAGSLIVGTRPGDLYATPTPNPPAAEVFNGDDLNPPFSGTTLPLIVPGPHVINSYVPLAKGGVSTSADNLVTDQTVSSMYVVFDRDMSKATLDGGDVLGMVGPTGAIQTQANNNQVAIPDGGSVSASVTFPADAGAFRIGALQVALGITHPNDADLTITLTSPDGTTVNLVQAGEAQGGNFNGTTFADSAPATVSAGVGPYSGFYRPDDSFGAAFAGKPLQGTWTLTVSDTKLNGQAGTLNQFGMTADFGPFTITYTNPATDPNNHDTPGHPRTFLVTFPTRSVSGTYSITLAPTVQSAAGDALDQNQNAGLDKLRSTPSAGVTTQKYTSGTAVPIGGGTAGDQYVSTLNVPDSFTIAPPTRDTGGNLLSSVLVQMDIQYPNDADLEAELVAPDGFVVHLFKNVGNTFPFANFVGTIFDDQAGTPIQIGGPPFTGSYNPDPQGGPTLTNLAGHFAQGTWKLVVTDDQTSGGSTAGQVLDWSLTLLQPQSNTGLGEPVADRSVSSFRIFTQDPTNLQSSQTWTAVGPNGMGAKVNGGNAEVAGRISAIAVDTSDPSGNTVYVGAPSGGIWKTTDFLTTDPAGPTYVPLTDNSTSSMLDIGSIAVFPRNNDPSQTIILAGTGEADSMGDPDRAVNTSRGDNPTSRGVGFLLSQDGGKTWQLLDSTNNSLPFAQRDHMFASIPGQYGVTTYKVIIDPGVNRQTGQVVMYAALSDVAPTGQDILVGDPNAPAVLKGGIWRSLDGGTTWTQMKVGEATDVVLDPNSRNPQSNNLQTVYGAFREEGVYSSPNQGQVWSVMAGTTGDPLIQNALNNGTPQPVPVNLNAGPNQAVLDPSHYAPNQFAGQIVLGKPALTGNPVSDLNYQGWLYAAVVTHQGNYVNTPGPPPPSALVGLYLTKDFGQNWTRVLLASINSILPTNALSPDVAITGNGVPGGQFGDYALTLTVDPSNPNVVYLGGTGAAGTTGLIRVDTTGVHDPHSFYLDNFNQDPANSLRTSITTAMGQGGGVIVQTPTQGEFFQIINGVKVLDPTADPYVNLIRDPRDPFLNDATILVGNTNIQLLPALGFPNNGQQARWVPFDQAVAPNAYASPFDPWSVPTSGMHIALAMADPLTGKTRLIFGDDQGIYTSVDSGNGDGSLIGSIGGVANLDTNRGNVPVVQGSRNGNLAVAQFYHGAAQPSFLSAQLAALSGFFYGSSEDGGDPASRPGIVQQGSPDYGNLSWYGPGGGQAIDRFPSRGGVATQQEIKLDKNGQPIGGTVFNYVSTEAMLNGDGPLGLPRPTTDTFQVNGSGQTFGMYQTSNPGPTPDAQWAYRQGFNFAINPRDEYQRVISSAAGRIFATADNGTSATTWAEIGNPGVLDGSNAQALAFGAPDSNVPANAGGFANFVYAGTKNGNIFVTFTGGGNAGQGNAWKNISGGLDGSPIAQIITNPTGNSHEAYAVTTGGAVRTQAQDATKPDGSANTGAIPEPGTFTSYLTSRAPSSFRIDNLRVLVNITHPSDADLGISLTGPDGTSIRLVRAGDANGADFTGTGFDDGSSTTIAGASALGGVNGTGPYTAVYRPLDPLGVFYNKPLAGVWTLNVTDSAVNNVTGTLDGWSLQATSLGSVYHIADSSKDTAWTPISGNLFDLTSDPLNDPALAGQHAIQSLGAIQADWRYVVPNDFANPGAGTHPLLYVAGAGGVLRSIDDGQTWTPFPQGAAGLDNSPLGDGGGLPTANVTDLSLSLGNIDPNTGRPNTSDTSRIGPNELVATTYGRGDFVIKLAPITFPNQVGQAPILHIDTTTDSGNPDIAGSDSDGITNNTKPLIDGLSEQTAFGNVVKITLFDATDPSKPPVYIGGYDGTPGDATDVAANRTKADGTFKVAVTVPFATDGWKLIMVQATDQAGTKGNQVFLTRDGKADRLPDGTPDPALSLLEIDTTAPLAPPNPVLDAASDSGISQTDAITNVNTSPVFDVTVSTGEPSTTTLYLDRDGNQVGLTNGTGMVPDGGPMISDGTHKYTTREIDLAGNAGPSSTPFFVTVDTQAPAPPTSVMLDPGSDSGTLGDNKTNVLNPVFSGTASANMIPEPNDLGAPLENNQILILDSAQNLQGRGPIASNGKFSVQSDLQSGNYTLNFQVQDVAGNLSALSKPLAIVINNQTLKPPTLQLVSTDDSGIVGDDITNVTQPHLSGLGTPGLNIQLIDLTGNITGQGPNSVIPRPAGVPPIVVANDGTYGVSFPSPLADGTYRVVAQMFDAFGNTATSVPLNLTILTHGPTTAPTLSILPGDDTGTKGDGVTSNRQPHLIGVTTPNAMITLIDPSTGATLATTTAGRDGHYSAQLAKHLFNGAIQVQARVVDVAGNQGVASAPLSLRLVTTPGDYDGDGKADPIDYDPTTGTFSVQFSATGSTAQVTPFAGQAGFTPRAGDVPISGDFDGDGKNDFAVYQPSTATWFIQQSTLGFESMQFGQPGVDLAVPGDFDGDGSANIAVYRPSNATWYIFYPVPTPNHPAIVQLGQPGVDEPVPGDYDGDGTTDLAVYRPSIATWLIQPSSGVARPPFQLGQPGVDIPMPADYNGDGTTDMAVYRPTTATWFELYSNNKGGTVAQLGQPGVDIPTPGDYDGDGKGDLALYRPPLALFLIQQTTAGGRGAVLGTPNVSIPVAAPYQFRQAPVLGQLSTGPASGFEPLTAAATPTPTPPSTPMPPTAMPAAPDLGRTAASFAAAAPTVPVAVPVAPVPIVAPAAPSPTPTGRAARRFALRAERRAATPHRPSPPPVAPTRNRLVEAILERLGLGRRA